jgi:hypothetical protein
MTMHLNRGFVDYIYQRFFRVSRLERIVVASNEIAGTANPSFARLFFRSLF